MDAISFRIVNDDNSIIEWGDPIVINHEIKAASIDNIDRSVAAQLITINSLGEPLNVITLTKEQRVNNRFVWRRYAGITPNGDNLTIGAIAGLNTLTASGTFLTLNIIYPDGTVVSDNNVAITLHPPELFN